MSLPTRPRNDILSTNAITMTRTTTATLLPFRTTTEGMRRSPRMPLSISTYGVPLAFTVLVVLILCMVIAYTKAKRRQMRQQQGPQNNLRSISGGVPMHVGAYRNYGMRLAATTSSGANLATSQGGYPHDLPPPYEVAIQIPSPDTPSTCPPTPGVPEMHAPPAYSESIQELTSSVTSHQLTGASPTSTGTSGSGVTPELAGSPGNAGDKSRAHKKSSGPPEVGCVPSGPKPQSDSGATVDDITDT